MEKVKLSKKTFDSLEKNTILSYEEAKWFMQKEGNIPIPRKSNKQNVSIIFIPSEFCGDICLTKQKIIKYRFTEIVYYSDIVAGYILAFETISSDAKENYYYPDFELSCDYEIKLYLDTKNDFERSAESYILDIIRDYYENDEDYITKVYK